MKTAFVLLFLSLTCFAQTNRPSAAAMVVRLPADVAQADAKCVALYKMRWAIDAQMLPLANKQSERAALRLPIDIGIASQINQLSYQRKIVNQQILPAEQWDYQIRDYHHLPRFNISTALAKRK